MNLSEFLMKERNPTEGSILKNILTITWPLWFNSGIWIVFYGLNIYWVSKLGTEAIAAVTAGSMGFMLFMALIQGLVTTTYALIGNLAGRHDWPEAEKLAKKILTATWLISLSIAFLGYFFAPHLLKLIGTEEKVLHLATTYLRIQAVGGIVSFSLWVQNGMIRSTGDMGRPMLVIFTVIVLNGIFDWLLILGNLGFPRLGVAGASLASALSASIGAVISFFILVKGYSPLKINLKKWRDFKIDFGAIKEIARIAGFDSLEMISKVIIEFVLLWCIAFWGTAALAVYGIGQRLLKMCSMPGFDLSMTTAIMVSNNLGIGETKRAEKSAWINMGLNILIMGLAGLCFFNFAEKIMSFYSRDAEVVKMGVVYLEITTIGYVFLAAGIILRRAFAGAKNTRITALTTILTLGVVQLSLACFLSKFTSLAISGVWWAILTAAATNGLTLTFLFKFKPNLWKKN